MKRVAWPLTLALAAVSGAAAANGRYPIANQLVVSPGDEARLVLRTTFGLVLSQDQGKTFSWVCEKAAGFVNGEDPPVEVTEDSSILVASSQALNISHDGGCAWQNALADLSIGNYFEMASHTTSARFILKKKFDSVLHSVAPSMWTPLYTMVAFTRTPFNDAVRTAERQDRALNYVLGAVGLGALGAAAYWFAHRAR